MIKLPLFHNKHNPGVVHDAEGWIVLTIHDCQKDKAEKAAYIVRVCTSHADLLDVCKKLSSAMDNLLKQIPLETEIDTPVLLRCQEAASMAEVLLAQEAQ